MKSQSKIILVGILAFFALAYFIWNTYQNARNAESMRQWVHHSYQVMEKIDHLSSSINQLESDARGWLLTHDDAFTAAAQLESQEVDQILRDLFSLTADNPKYQHQVSILSNLVAEKVQFHLSQLQKT